MNSEYILTIVTATFNLINNNRVDKFRQCMESVHKQSCIDCIEHIVVDGKSSDGTAEILAGYEKKGYCRVISQKDSGVYEAMNNGLAEAKGKYILFLNSDDFIFNSHGLEEVLKELTGAGVDYCFGDAKVLNSDDSFNTVWKGTIQTLPFAQNYCHQTMIVKTSVLREHGGFDLQYKVSADSEIMLFLYKNRNPYIHTNTQFACYRLGGLSSSALKTGQDDHSRCFYTYFGKEAGLSLTQCQQLWNFRGIHAFSADDYLDILVKLPDKGWREIWLYIMPKLVIKERNLYEKIKHKFYLYGFFGVLKKMLNKIKG